MGINSLEETEGDPSVNSDNVQVPHKVAVQQRPCNSPGAKDKYLQRGVRILLQAEAVQSTCGESCGCACTRYQYAELGELQCEKAVRIAGQRYK